MKNKTIEKDLEKFYNTTYLSHEEKVDGTPALLRRLITFREFTQRFQDAKSILDAGCSKGYLSKINNKDIKLYGIDLSKKLLDKVKGYFETKKSTLTKIPYKKNAFDAVVCFQVLEHIKDYKLALRELVRTSSKYVLLSTDFVTKTEKANSRDPMSNPHGHIHQFNFKNFVNALNDLNLEIVYYEYHYPLFEFSTIQRQNNIFSKILRKCILGFSRVLNFLLRNLYFKHVVKSYNNKKKTFCLIRLEKFFEFYGKIVDLEVEIAILLQKRGLS